MKSRFRFLTHRFNLRVPTSIKRFLILTKVLGTTILALTLVTAIVATPAIGTTFFFSTGNPDGKIATLSRVASPGKIQTETADDFVLTNCTVIDQATFIGLLPLGTPVSNVNDVEIEIYHVFPKDSVQPPSGNVPTRANSPGDVEIASATRDALDGSLSFSATVLNANFTAANSVVNGINKFPNQTTHGEGPVTGEEVLISVTFNRPIALPPDHYFFRPELLVNGGDFLWLSAPRPIIPPGTPFPAGNTDLQSWIRNDNLSPDWLRIGADIIGIIDGNPAPAFNATFSLTGETDADCDGVGDSVDQCPDTPPGAIVNADGCSIDQLVPCSGPASGGTWKNHGQYVSSIAHTAESFVAQGLITEEQKGAIVSAAARSNCGKNSKVGARRSVTERAAPSGLKQKSQR
ncbi:MAG TPA: hypothetical protein VIV66_20355 [Pyrinomonadaceae bacterium]